MDKAEWMRKFIKENIQLLTSGEATTQVVKLKIQEFRRVHELLSSQSFYIRDITFEVAKYILQGKNFTKESFEAEVKKIPFMKEKLTSDKLENVFLTYSNPSAESIISEDELKEIGKVNKITLLEDRIRQRLTEELQEKNSQEIAHLEEMRKEIESQFSAKQKFYSELDKIPQDLDLDRIPIIKKHDEEELNYDFNSEWWEDVGLTDNPFPNFKGIKYFAKDKYSNVVVETQFIKDYLSYIENSAKSLIGRSTLIAGEYGSGKSTMFQYMASIAVRSKILPIEVSLNPGRGVYDLTSSMLEQLLDVASRTIQARDGFDPRSTDSSNDPLVSVANLLDMIAQNKSTESFLIFVDGTYKGLKDNSLALRFLQQLQTVQEHFDNRGIKSGFLIAGPLPWLNDLERTPSLSGSLDRIQKLPAVSEDDAITAVVKRIELFSKETDSEGIKIDESGLRQLYRVLKKRLTTEITFRDYFKELEKKLRARKFGGIGIDVSLHIETVALVHDKFSKSLLGKEFQAIWKELYKRPELKYSCQRAMNGCYGKGLSESDSIFQENDIAMSRLRKYGFIAPRSNSGIDSIRWYPSSEFLYVTSEICKSASLSPRRVIRAIFEEQEYVRQAEALSLYSGILFLLDERASGWLDSYPDISKKLKECRLLLLTISSNTKSEDRHKLSWKELSNSVKILVELINERTYSHPDSTQPWKMFSESWVAPENVQTILKYSVEKYLPNGDTPFYGLLQEHSQIISDLLAILTELIAGEGISRLKDRVLSFDQLTRIHDLRNLFNSLKYKEVAKGCGELLEDAIRENLFYALRVLYGDESIGRLPNDLKKKIEEASSRGHPRLQGLKYGNFLYALSRSEYGKILFNEDNFNLLFKDLLNRDEQKEKTKDSVALLFSLYDKVQHNAPPDFYSGKISEIGETLRFLPRFLEILHKANENLINKADTCLKFDSEQKSFTFKYMGNGHPENPISIKDLSNLEASKYICSVIENQENHPSAMVSLASICDNQNIPPEISIAIYSRLIRSGNLVFEKQSFVPFEISLSDPGREYLCKNCHK